MHDYLRVRFQVFGCCAKPPLTNLLDAVRGFPELALISSAKSKRLSFSKAEEHYFHRSLTVSSSCCAIGIYFCWSWKRVSNQLVTALFLNSGVISWAHALTTSSMRPQRPSWVFCEDEICGGGLYAYILGPKRYRKGHYSAVPSHHLELSKNQSCVHIQIQNFLNIRVCDSISTTGWGIRLKLSRRSSAPTQQKDLGCSRCCLED